MTTIAFQNGLWQENAFLTPTHEVLTAQGVFETILVKEQVPQFLDFHLARLKRSSEILGITTPESDEITSGIRQLLRSQHDAPGRLRITLYGGVPKPQLLLSLVEFTPWPAHVTVNISPWTRNVNSPIVGAKSASYAENALALNLAREMNYSETLFFNHAGQLAEAATSNIVIVVDGEAITPPLSSGCLPGITRQIILESGSVREASIDDVLLGSASAAALLSSTRGVQPINVLVDRELNSADETLRQLAAVFEVRVAQDKENWAKLP
jgi:branched-chain amino acid aminotransferase